MKILFVSLGCDKNLVDSESMTGLLARAGYEFTDDEAEAEIIVVNTCCFIGDAKEESIRTILELASWKKKGRCRVLLATGCLAERYQDEICKEIPELDGVLGTASYDYVTEMVEQTLKGQHYERFESVDRPMDLLPGRMVTTGGHYAYLKIAEGCDRHCTYCVIPGVRGRYRSFSMEQLLAQARELADGGVRELILVAQETTLYGTDLYGHKALPELLTGLCRIPGLYWIRLQYCYPEEITKELIDVIRREPKICHYLDMPIQHASDSILKRMGRRTCREELIRQIDSIRKAIPDICLRTTLIAGFPGETQEDHEALMAFVDECEFDRLGVFAYSQEENTPAAAMPDQIPDEVRESRRDSLMELQQEIAFDKCSSMEGRILDVMIEGRIADENAYVGRTYMDAPGVDGLIFVHTAEELMTGDFVRVRVTGALEYDLIGEIEDELTQ
ncbi:MAG: 30S ribosomal protein S12 methylthiotransferase RimO [Lachnospiraceae bacterium]|jgi:ribosomal protein S12 methylthiotransferase|nr:30S ribosomal protein S12 methylthiotransferase RimO [Lachnospiraceae bacterium]